MPGEYDFGRMQEEAARRMREMQARARSPQGSRPRHTQAGASTEASHEPPSERPPRQPDPPAPEEPAVSQSASPQEVPPQTNAGGLLENLFQDKERTIILALLILLGSEGNNHELMFALLFLLM